MAAFSNTELNASVQEQWDMELEEARYPAAPIMANITTKTGKVTQKNDILNITVDSVMTAGTVSAAGAFTPPVRTPTSIALTMGTWAYVAAETTDRVEYQSWFDPKSIFPGSAAKAFAVQYDTDIAALWSNLTGGNIGSQAQPVSLGDPQIRSAMLIMANNNIPMDNQTFLIPPVAVFNGVLAEGVFKNAYQIGGGGKTPMITGNYEFPLLGVKFVMSTLLAAVDGNVIKAMLIHKSAFAIGMQMNNRYRTYNRLASNVFADGIAAESLYGVITVRANHGVIIHTALT